MSGRSYVSPGLVLSVNPNASAQVLDLQQDLRALGYAKGPLDGVYGNGTAAAVQALRYDLLHNDGSSTQNDGNAPVAMRDYNNGRVDSVTDSLDQDLAACIVAMLDDDAFPKLASAEDPAAENARAVAAVQAMSPCPVPAPFLLAILQQESGCQHYRVPSGANTDSFITVGLDHNNAENAFAITSRGYGMGQFTLFHHPPTADEMQSVIVDPVKNVARAVSVLLDKFSNHIAGATSDVQADDRIAEVGHGPLRLCQYPCDSSQYMNNCAACATAAQMVNIQSGVTTWFAGSSGTYAQTQYHKGSYSDVPVRKQIPCDWPYAVRRYNGAGTNSYDYQAEVLLRIAGRRI